jgi:hypothetical protein
MSESIDTAARERLEALAGTWTMAAGPPGGPPWPGAAEVTFAWMEGAPLLVQRWSVEMEGAPGGTAVIGCDGRTGAYRQLHTDDRDVQRIYEMSLEDGVWRLWREGPPFSQRFTGRFSADGTTIAGRWELAEPGVDWRTDFDITFTRVG